MYFILGVTVEVAPSEEKESIGTVLSFLFVNLNAELLMMLNGFGWIFNDRAVCGVVKRLSVSVWWSQEATVILSINVMWSEIYSLNF